MAFKTITKINSIINVISTIIALFIPTTLGLPHTHSHIYTRRGCVPEDIVSSISSGDRCAEQSVVDAYFSAEYPAIRKSHTAYQTRITNVTFCVCDNADKCSQPTGDSIAESAESVPGSGEAEGSPEASGNIAGGVDVPFKKKTLSSGLVH